MKLSDFDYYLPKNLIAQKPKKPRSHSRLLVIKRKGCEKVGPLRPFKKNRGDSTSLEHKHFYDLSDYLRAGDILVLNNSKVFPARLIGKKAKTNGRVEVFLHRKIRGRLWECLVGGRVREGLLINFARGLSGEIVKNNKNGTWEVKFNKSVGFRCVFIYLC